ncbi:MAG: hypothetical protein IAF08_06540 [Rhizobacter sp.]|nr:hypothetical protein [Chlorobiales bacterium]
MHTKFFFTFAVVCLALPQPAQPQTPPAPAKRLLILGDSHLMGDFGEFLHRRLHESGKYDVLSIAICGAGSYQFAHPFENDICGYKIRESKAGEVLIKNKVRVLEISRTKSKGAIGKDYGGSTAAVLQKWKPDAVIVSLGANFINAHQPLVDILKGYNPAMRFVWVSPFLRENFAARLQAIKKVIKDNPHGVLVRSDDIMGSDTLSGPNHFTGSDAKVWANKIAQRAGTHLDTFFDTTKTATVTAPPRPPAIRPPTR